MRIIEIVALSNGAHRNQIGNFMVIPDGWAVIPVDMETPASFPFVGVVAEDVNGVMTVTSMTEGEFPAPTPTQETEPTELERLRADIDYIAVMTGVEL